MPDKLNQDSPHPLAGRCRQCGKPVRADSRIQTRLGSFCGMACAERAELSDTMYVGARKPEARRGGFWRTPPRLAAIVLLILVIVYCYLVLFQGVAGPGEFVKILREWTGR